VILKRTTPQLQAMLEIIAGYNVQEMNMSGAHNPMTEETSVVQQMESHPTVALSATVETTFQLLHFLH